MALTQVSSEGIKDAQVKTADILDANITTAKVADNAITGAKVADNLDIPDSNKIRFGTDVDLEIYHSGGINYITSPTDKTIRITAKTGEDGVKVVADDTVELYHNNSKKFETTSAGVAVTGTLTAGTDVYLSGTGLDTGDNVGLKLGDSDDFLVYHAPGGSGPNVIDNVTSNLEIRHGSEVQAKFIQDGAVELYYNNVKTFQTGTHGASVHAPEGGSAQFYMYADEGDDNADQWGLIASHSSSKFSIDNYAGGGWETSFTCEGNGAAKLFYDDSKKFETTSAGATVSGQLTVDGNLISYSANNNSLGLSGHRWNDLFIANDIDVLDNGKLLIGTGDDLQIYHDGSSRIYHNGGGDLLVSTIGTGENLYVSSAEHLLLRTAASEDAVYCTKNGSVGLYYDNSKKFETHSNGCIFTGDLYGLDNAKVRLGNSNDFELWHDPSNGTFIKNSTSTFHILGDLVAINDAANAQNMIVAVDGAEVRLYYNGALKLETTSYGVFVTGTFRADVIDMQDNKKSNWGNDDDLQIFHDGSDNIIDCRNDKNLRIVNDHAGGNEVMISCDPNGSVELYYNGTKQIETSSAGVSVPGRLDIGNSLGTAHAGKLQVIHEGGGNLSNDTLAFFETNSMDWVLMTNSNIGGSASHYHLYMMEEGSTRGSISGNHGSNVTYNQGSDYRWKENVVEMTGTEGIDICKKLKPSKYNWIKNREGTGQINTVDGFIAHEVEEAGVRGAVTGEKDAVNEDGSIDGQCLDYGQMTPVLAAAIKGLITKVETLETEVAALKAG